MKKTAKTVVAIMLTVSVLLNVFFISISIINFKKENNAKKGETAKVDEKEIYYEVTEEEIEATLEKICDLAVYDYEYDAHANINFPKRIAKKYRIPLTIKNLDMSGKGTVEIVTDLTKSTIKVDSESRTIYVTLPRSTVKSNRLDVKTIECKETEALFNRLHWVEAKFTIQYLENMGATKAQGEKVLEKADERAKEIVETFVESVTDYKVVCDVK